MRKGMTVVELLVSVAIIATLIGLLLPAIQRIRESALCQQSLNNLRQISLATAHYAQQHQNWLPSLSGFAGDPVDVVFLAILPYIEQESLHAYYKGYATFDPKNPINQTVSIYINPLDPSNYQSSMSFMTAGVPVSSYACNAQVFTGKPKLASITDGTSTTIMFSEHYKTCGSVKFFNYLGGAPGSRTNLPFPGNRASFADGGPLVDGGYNCDD